MPSRLSTTLCVSRRHVSGCDALPLRLPRREGETTLRPAPRVLHPTSCIPYPTSRTPYPASHTPQNRVLHPTALILRPASHTGASRRRSEIPARWHGVLGISQWRWEKLEGSRAALITGRPACSAQSQQKARSPVSRQGCRGSAGCSRAAGFVSAPRKTTLSARTGQHPRGAARTGTRRLCNPGCKQAPEPTSGLSQPPAFLSAAKAGGNLGGKVPP